MHALPVPKCTAFATQYLNGLETLGARTRSLGRGEPKSRFRDACHCGIEEITPLLYSPTGLDLKAGKQCPESA